MSSGNPHLTIGVEPQRIILAGLASRRDQSALGLVAASLHDLFSLDDALALSAVRSMHAHDSCSDVLSPYCHLDHIEEPRHLAEMVVCNLMLTLFGPPQQYLDVVGHRYFRALLAGHSANPLQPAVFRSRRSFPALKGHALACHAVRGKAEQRRIHLRRRAGCYPAGSAPAQILRLCVQLFERVCHICATCGRTTLRHSKSITVHLLQHGYADVRREPDGTGITDLSIAGLEWQWRASQQKRAPHVRVGSSASD
jgi:hypothetical protein